MVTKPKVEPEELHETEEDGFELTPEEEAELEDRYQEVLRGDYVDGDVYQAELKKRIGRA